jgi:hypothetical protein
MSQDVNPAVLQLRCTRGMVDVVANHLLVNGLPVPITKHERSAQMPRGPQRGCKPLRQWNVAQLAAFRRTGMALPHGSLDTELTLLEIDIVPLQRRDLPAPKTCFSSKENHQVCLVTPLQCRPDQPLERVKIVKRR